MAANVNVFRGSDAALVLAVDDKQSVEGKLADGIITQYELASVVGRLQRVAIRVQNELKPYHEIGKRFPTELRSGNLDVSGYAERAHVNGALIKLLLGEGATSPPPTGAMPQPGFNMVVNLADPGMPGNSIKLVLFGVKFDSWNFALPEDDFVMEAVTFKALRIASEEATA
jgi:hypothetical protein